MFFRIGNTDIASYADDNTQKTRLQMASVKRLKWFPENSLKAKQNKCHFLSSLDINKKFLLPAYILENSDS